MGFKDILDRAFNMAGQGLGAVGHDLSQAVGGWEDFAGARLAGLANDVGASRLAAPGLDTGGSRLAGGVDYGFSSPSMPSSKQQSNYEAGQAAYNLWHPQQAQTTSTTGQTGATAGGGAQPGDAGWGSPDTAAIDRQLGGRGTRNAAISAASVQQMAQRYGVPVAVVLAVLNQESGYGTDQNQLTANNNFMGLTGTGTKGSVTLVGPDGKARTFATFNTPEEGLDAAIRNMAAPQYHNLTLQQYLALYLTGDVNGGDDGAGNRTADYVNNAINIARNLGLNIGPNTVVVRPGVTGGRAPVNSQGTAFPVQGYQGQVALHWGEDRGAADLFAPVGTPVAAMRGGRVEFAGYDDVGGYAVQILGDDGLTYYYAHLQQPPSVREGQTVAGGTIFGAVGNTGNASGGAPHLHIGIGYGIQTGTGPRGGSGINFDATSYLSQVLGLPVAGGGAGAAN